MVLGNAFFSFCSLLFAAAASNRFKRAQAKQMSSCSTFPLYWVQGRVHAVVLKFRNFERLNIYLPSQVVRNQDLPIRHDSTR